MRKCLIKIQKIFFALMFLFTSVSTYAAVGANDGSAFVTKAEFDALVNTFNEQMDTYANSINSKIDGSIANYLNGLSNEVTENQDSYLNKINPTFINTWDPFETRPGINYRYFMYVGEHFFNNLSGSYQGAEYKVSSDPDDGDKGTWIYKNNTDSNKGSFVRYYTINTNGVEALVPDARIESVMVSAVEACAVGHAQRSGAVQTPPTLGYVNATKSITRWGSQEFSVNGSWADANYVCAGMASFTSDDKITLNTALTDQPFTNLAGTDIPTVDTYSILSDEYEIIGDKYDEGKAGVGYNNSLGQRGNTNYTVPIANFKIAIYRHKHSTKKWTDFSHGNLTLLMGEPIKYYNGAPMFKASIDGTCKVDLQFVNSDSTAINTFMLKNAKFDNVPTAGSSSGIVNLLINGKEPKDDSYRTLASAKLSLQFTAKKNEIYWIKVLPNKGTVRVNSESIVISSE